MRYAKIIAISALLALTSPAIANGQDTDKIEAMIDNVSSEMIACMAYYQHIAWGMENSGKAELSKQFKETADKFLVAAIKSSSAIRSDDMTIKVLENRTELYMSDMTKSMDSNYANISIIMNGYGNN